VEIRSEERFKHLPLILVATKTDEFDDQDTLNSRCESESGLGPNGSDLLILQENANSSGLHSSKVVRSSKRVTKEKGLQTAEFEGFIQYIETSALFGEGVKNVFDETIHAIVKD
jgi:GTPase SAR1 family protein